jgi:thiamine-phosphate pyrophosphorylase
VLSPLHAILDVGTAAAHGWDPCDLARAFFDGGARLVQVRAKALPSGSLLALCDQVVHAASAYHATVIVNDRADIALMSGASGVHVGQDDLAPATVRRMCGAAAIVGHSTHTIQQIEAAVRAPISYLAVGPIFSTGTKASGYEPVGLERIGEALRLAHGLPIVGIGGITLERARSVVDAGAASVAVISDLLTGGAPSARVRAFLDALS